MMPIKFFDTWWERGSWSFGTLWTWTRRYNSWCPVNVRIYYAFGPIHVAVDTSAI